MAVWAGLAGLFCAFSCLNVCCLGVERVCTRFIKPRLVFLCLCFGAHVLRAKVVPVCVIPVDAVKVARLVFDAVGYGLMQYAYDHDA